jgi:3-oxoacyl-[acyl-carrier-protein] synthase-3
MRFENVCLEAVVARLPPEVLSSDEIEARLQPVYDRLGHSSGRLELMTGIRERRCWPRGTKPGDISGLTVIDALAAASVAPEHVGVLVHGSVCRDQLEPATASRVHALAGLSTKCLALDVSNACLGLLNGVLLVANMIELRQVRCGVIVGTELGRDLVEGTIDTLLADPNLTRRDLKLAFASLTIGSASAAIVLTDRESSRTGRRLLGGAVLAETSHHRLCAGGVESESYGDDRPRMQTDSEALLYAGVELAERTWAEAKRRLSWTNASVTRVVTHQVGRAHKKLLYERLGLDPAMDFSTVEFLGNTGAAALPVTAALAEQNGHIRPGDTVAWLGIGSGLHSVMLGWQW